MSTRRNLALATVLLPFAAISAINALAEDAGITGAVNTDVTGTPPGGSVSNLAVGRIVVRDEHILSNADGLAQLLFLDQTTLTVGPNSDVVIDEFVYDPATKDGKLLMEASVGLFRVIGGESATSGGITVATPFATMGIRGSNVVIEISPNGKTRVTCTYCERVEIRLLNDPDNLVTIFGSDRFRTIEIGPDGFSAPFELTPEEVAQLQDLLTSKPGRHGGIAKIPSEPEVSEQADGSNNSNIPPKENDPHRTPPVQQGYNDQVIGNPREETEAAQDQNEMSATGETGTLPPLLLFSGGGFISTPGVVSFAVDTAGWSGDLDDPNHTQAIASATQSGSQLTLQLAGGGAFNLPWQAGSFNFTGGSTPGGSASGSGFVSPNGEFFAYSLFESGTGNADFLFGGQEIDPAEHFQQYMAWDLQPDVLGGELPFLNADMTVGIDPSNITRSPLYFVSAQPDGGTHYGTYGMAALGFQGTGPEQSSVFMYAVLEGQAGDENFSYGTLHGQAGGFASQPLGASVGNAATGTRLAQGDTAAVAGGNGNPFFGGQDGVYFVLGSGKWDSFDNDDVFVDVDLTPPTAQETLYEPLHVAAPSSTPLPGDFGQDSEGFYHRGYAAGAADLHGGDGFMSLHGTLEMAFNTEADNFAVMNLDTQGTETVSPPVPNMELGFADGLFIDRQRILLQGDYYAFFTNTGSVSNAGFISHELVLQPGDSLPGGATACACTFMEWGFWAADVNRTSGPAVTATIPIGTWIAGDQIENDIELPDSGVASYEGHAIANILSAVDGATASYVASGALSVQVDFGSRDLNGSISNLDNRDYTFSADYTGFSGATFNASGQSTDSLIELDMNGGFFRGPQSAAQGIGGAFTLAPSEINPEDYSGTGTFIGEQVPQ